MIESLQLILQLCCPFLSHMFLVWNPFFSLPALFYCNCPLLNCIFATIMYTFYFQRLYCPINQCLPLSTFAKTEVWLGAPTVWYYLRILTSPRGLQVSWAVAQHSDRISKFLIYDCSLVWEECFIKPKKMMAVLLKTKNSNHTSRSLRQPLSKKGFPTFFSDQLVVPLV